MRTAKDNFVERYDNGTYSEVDMRVLKQTEITVESADHLACGSLLYLTYL